MKELSVTKHRTLAAGFVSALRDHHKFEFFLKLFAELDKFSAEFLTKRQSPGLYLKERYGGDNTPADLFEKISLAYQKGVAPLKESPTETFLSFVHGNFGEASCDDEMLFFCNMLSEETDSETDFILAKDMLYIDVIDQTNSYTPSELRLQKTNFKAAVLSRNTRYKHIESLFSSAGNTFVSSASEFMFQTMDKSKKIKNFMTYSGFDVNSFDVHQAFPARGMINVVAATSDGKTLFKSSVAANHVIRRIDNEINSSPDFKPTTIWGYVGEDSIETYTDRIVVNVINSRYKELNSLYKHLSLSPMTGDDYDNRWNNDKKFRSDAEFLIRKFMDKLHWLTPPNDIVALVNFSLESIIRTIEAKMSTEGTPDLIILDYIQLLNLDKKSGLSSKRVEELNTIATIINSWSMNNNVPILCSAQATAEGGKKSRDGVFHEIEDIADAKGIAKPAPMVLSLIRVPVLSDTGEFLGEKHAIKVLKSRKRGRGSIFISDLDLPGSKTFFNTRLIDEKDWNAMVARIRNIRSQDTVNEQKKPQNSRFNQGKPQGQSQQQKPRAPIPPPDDGEI